MFTLSIFLTLPTSFDNYQVPQLWESSLRMYGGSAASNRRLSTIAEVEAEREREARQKADDKKALADAKPHGKEAVAAIKARIVQEHATASEAKKIEKLRITAERKAEKARVAAETKARQAEKRVRTTCLLSNIH